MRETFV